MQRLSASPVDGLGTRTTRVRLATMPESTGSRTNFVAAGYELGTIKHSVAASAQIFTEESGQWTSRSRGQSNG